MDTSIPQMALHELRVKVAELCGWKPHGSFLNCSKQTVYCWLLGSPETEDGQMAYGEKDLPNYCRDLNACHEMEQQIPREKDMLYWKYLVDICCDFPGTAVERATAEQRCRAFVATMEAPSVEPKRPKSEGGSEFPKPVFSNDKKG